MLGFHQHEVRSGSTDFRASGHPAEMLRFDMLATCLKAVGHGHAETQSIAAQTLLNAGRSRLIVRHGGCSRGCNQDAVGGMPSRADSVEVVGLTLRVPICSRGLYGRWHVLTQWLNFEIGSGRFFIFGLYFEHSTRGATP